LLQSALGELPTKAGLRAANVFAGFITMAGRGGPLKHGDVVAYAQGALLELAFFYAAFARGNARASELGVEGGRLRDAMLKSKAACFEVDERLRRQIAREMLTGMRLYYADALACRGVSKERATDMLKSAFGREGAIVNDALAIFAEPQSARSAGRWHRLLGRSSLD
jgi:hypothetical protein